MMTRAKSTFVTALVAGMLAAILYGLWRLYPRAYMGMLGLLALFGFACLTLMFFCWIGGGKREKPKEKQEKTMLPPEVKSGLSQPAASAAASDAGETRSTAEENWAQNEAWVGSYDTIRAEVRAEEGAA